MGFLNSIINLANAPVPEWEPAEPTHKVVLHWCVRDSLITSGKLEEWPLETGGTVPTARKNAFQWESPLVDSQHPHAFIMELTVGWADRVKFEGTSRAGRHYTATVLAQRISSSCYVMVEVLQPEISSP